VPPGVAVVRVDSDGVLGRGVEAQRCSVVPVELRVARLPAPVGIPDAVEEVVPARVMVGPAPTVVVAAQVVAPEGVRLNGSGRRGCGQREGSDDGHEEARNWPESRGACGHRASFEAPPQA
jgi:hypothetical protein